MRIFAPFGNGNLPFFNENQTDLYCLSQGKRNVGSTLAFVLTLTPGNRSVLMSGDCHEPGKSIFGYFLLAKGLAREVVVVTRWGRETWKRPSSVSASPGRQKMGYCSEKAALKELDRERVCLCIPFSS